MEITCAYDPNDKQVFPLGYTDEHWLLPETKQEFLVRFQNTGNAPAQDVRIQDTIDVNFDLSTFKLVANSHSVMATINQETRVADFFFENIQLPDSTNNESESHGLISYAITPLAELPVGTELNNTAYIYFDNNEAIVTNTTWVTIHECGGEAEFEVSYPGFCLGEEVTLTSLYPSLESYSWQLDGQELSDEFEFSFSFEEVGEHEIIYMASNPICSAISTEMITITDLPAAEITENGAVFTASEGASYQWLLNGNPIDGATSQTYEALEDGAYSVIVTNEANCSSSSEVIIVNVNELESQIVLIYPNPMTNVAYISFKDASTKTIKLLDLTGKEVRVWTNIVTDQLEIQKGDLAVGNYIIHVIDAEEEFSVKLSIVK